MRTFRSTAVKNVRQEPAGNPELARLKPPLEEVGQVTGLAVPATLTDDQRRRCRLQLHTGETLPQSTGNSQHVIGTVVTDRQTLVLAEVPANLVRLHRLAGIQRRAQRTGSDALGLGGGNELVDELLRL